ncbi:VOC family protein [Jatrophihabitans sp. YIM 134969]
MTDTVVPHVRQIVLDAVDIRGLAEFYRQLLGWTYRPGDEPPVPADEEGWLVLQNSEGGVGLAFQRVDTLPTPSWPENTPVPQQLHLDTTVPDVEALTAVHDHALALGATVLLDRTDDPEEPLWVFADPAGHPFCVFVG